MAYSLTVAGYTFENPPEEYRKLARLSNSPQTAFNRRSTAFYQSDSQDLQFQVEGTLALDPPLGEPSDDLAELERLQEIAIEGGEVNVEFDPFFSGKAVIEDDPFRQSDGESSYQFTFSVNSEDTDDTAYPSHSTPGTGNTFELGDLDLGYDPSEVSQNYERQTEKVKRLQGIARTVDTEGLIPKVNVSGLIDGGGQAELWDKARSNKLAYLSAEFQNGWALLDSLSIRNAPEAPDYLTGLFRYDMDLLIVMDPDSGIGETTKYVDQDVKGQTQYVSNCDEDGVLERLGNDTEDYPEALDYRISGGTGKLDSEYIEWQEEFGTLDQSTTNYIWVEDGDGDGYGQVNTGTSGFPGSSVPLYEVDTGNSSVNDIRDMRSCLTGTRLDYDSLGDLNFSDDLAVSDQRFAFERLVSLADSMAVSDPVERWLGLADFTDTLSATDQDPLWQRIIGFSDSASLDDGGSFSGGGGGTVESLAWGSESDWDGASSESNVEHASDPSVVKLRAYEGFEDSNFADNWVNHWNTTFEQDTADPIGGSSHLRFQGQDDWPLSFERTDWAYTSSDVVTMSGWFAADANNSSSADMRGAIAFGIQDTDNFYMASLRESNNALAFEEIIGANNDSLQEISYSLSDGEYVKCEITHDVPGNTVTIDWYQRDGTHIGTVGPLTPNTELGAGTVGINAYRGAGRGTYHYGDEVVANIYTSGSITTSTKTFSDAADSGSFTLKNVAATLNGQTIDVYVESDPDADGTFEETSDPITLDGSGGPYNVNGLSSNTANVRLRIELSTSDTSQIPEFDAADLENDGVGGAGQDSDQNPNTTWEIFGATHDSSGNEYEGGGVISRYGG